MKYPLRESRLNSSRVSTGVRPNSCQSGLGEIRIIAKTLKVELVCKETAHFRFNAPTRHASAARGSLTEQSKVGTTPHQIRRDTLYRAFRPYLLHLNETGSLTDEMPGIIGAQNRVPCNIMLPIYVPNKIGKDLVGAAGVEKEKLGQFSGGQ